ncbi:acyl-CoA thioesterase [Actinomadura chibensis]|uniref:Acyl-CoA thioesterase II n=1 Tax=Actinomadura chibensis TaxID=392828 RepID=A0A5D0NC72_9ACTN|nr:acyl-CoA thioesterase domain-containing protein [Actinomadura chibensis]TYB41973.1 acyl-CoA thioesterase II [Actinomadura chibensis]
MSDIPSEAPSRLARLFDLAPLGEDVFATTSRSVGRPRLFGGQVAGQSLRAACLTADGRPPHSLHAYFIRPGMPDEPLTFEVARTRDGRSFSTRHVTASQGGKPILELIASFHDPEDGFDWQEEAPSGTPGPEGLTELVPPEFFGRPFGFDVRLVDPPEEGGFPLRHPFWIRAADPVGDDPGLHACLIAYLSDMAVVSGARAPGSPRELATAVSLDHAVWFHRPPRVDRWLLYTVDPVTNHGARGLARGALRAEDGTLLASVQQEALLRPVSSARSTE